MRIKRTPNDGNLCDFDQSPDDGFTCAVPSPSPPLKVCGPCGLLSRGTIPLGAYYMNAKGPGRYRDPNLIPDCPQSCAPDIPDKPKNDSSNTSTHVIQDSEYFVPMVVLACVLLVALTVIVYQAIQLSRYSRMKDVAGQTSSTSNPLVSQSASPAQRDPRKRDVIAPGGDL